MQFRKNKMHKEPEKIVLIFFLLLLLFLSTSFVFAATLETDLPTIVGQKPNASTTFPAYVKYLFNFSMFVGALLVLGVLVWSGFRYLTSGNNPAVIGDVKKKIYGAFLGLLILLSTYLILTTINPGLVILGLHIISPTPTSTTPVIPDGQASTTFQEIPLGTIIEDLLAGNASTTLHPNLRCYKYDANGDTVDVNGDGQIDGADAFNYNDFYCIDLVNKAFEIKVENFLDKVKKDLKPLLNGCSCGACATFRNPPFSVGCETKWPDPCGKCCHSYCDPHCSCCGKARGTDPGCLKIDPCPVAVRKKMDCKRQELKQLIDGGVLLGEDGLPVCIASYDPAKDPTINPKIKFLTLQAAANRVEAFHLAFSDSLQDLKEAELLMKSPYGKRLTLQEFYSVKKGQEKAEKVEFKNYSNSDYCKEFKCEKTNAQGICIECSLNSEKRMCRIDNKGIEYYVTTGDNATFYVNEEGQYRAENIVPGEKCMVNPKEEKGFQIGLIPIGETVDEAEKFATKILLLYDFLLENYQKTMDVATNLLNSPDGCNCNRCSNISNCGPKCGGCNGECPSAAMDSCSGCNSCFLSETQQKKNPSDETGLAWKWEVACCQPPPGWFVPDMDRLKNICPIEEVDQEMASTSNPSAILGNYSCCKYSTSSITGALIAEISTTSSWAVTQKITTVRKTTNMGKPLDKPYTTTTIELIYPEPLGYLQIIEMVYQRMEELFNGIKLDIDDLNKCQILDKLTISREKMMKCITGFGVSDAGAMAKERTLSCSSAWEAKRSPVDMLIILPDFPNPKNNSYLNCYPYNSSDLNAAQKLQCLQNRISPKCASSTYYLLDNYYCCSGGSESGGFGGGGAGGR